MRRGLTGALVTIAVATSVTLGFLWARGSRATPVGPGERLPPVELPFAMAPSKSRLDALRGAPLLLVFMELHSPGGLSFANSVERLHRRFLRRGLNLVAIALDADANALKATLATNPITYQVLHDPASASTSPVFGVSQPGDAYLVGSDGQVLAVFAARDDWSDNRIPEAIESVLRPGP